MMQSRVRRCTSHGFADPAGLGRVAASVLADQHETGGAPGFGSKLQSPSSEERERLVGFSDDQAHGGGSQCLLDAPKKVGLACRAHQMQALADAAGEAAQHWQFGHMRGQDPDKRSGMPCRLKKGKGTPATPLSLMHTGRAEHESIAGLDLKPHYDSMRSLLSLGPANSEALALCRDVASAAHCGF